jgi:serine phosphatase RsbU (regulator of sigma subunit)
MTTEPTTPQPRKLACSEVWGGNKEIYTPVELPGMRGFLYSRPCEGGRGGDVHYLSVCNSGILSRVCLADVCGHGPTVAAISTEIHKLLRRSMNKFDQRKVLADLNRRLTDLGLKAMTTMAAMSYYHCNGTMSVSYAGHPPGWQFIKSENRWTRLELDQDPARVAQPSPVEKDDSLGLINGPMAIDPSATYTRLKIKPQPGDKFLFVTDGVLEAFDESKQNAFGPEGVDRVLNTHPAAGCGLIAGALLDSLTTFMGNGQPADDISFVVVEIVPGPPGPMLWHVLKNRVLHLGAKPLAEK